MKQTYDILIVGVGGQGTILASNVLGRACLIEGRHVVGAETHGMAQRGGSVESHIRIDGTAGPIIAAGTAALLISFDLLEAVRYRHFLAPDGVLVSNARIIIPTPVFQQGMDLPDSTRLRAALADLEPCIIDADAIALEAGSPLTQNIVILGAASHEIPLSPDSVLEAVRLSVPKKTVVLNEAAFNLGRDAGRKCRDFRS